MQRRSKKITGKPSLVSQRNLSENRLDNQGKPQNNAGIRVTSSYYSGLVPPASEMRGYGDIYPDAPKRFMDNAEIQIKHRINIEERSVKGNEFRSNTGLFLGFLAMVVLSAFGGLLVWNGKDIQGFSILIGTITPLVVNFFNQKKKRDKELEDKR